MPVGPEIFLIVTAVYVIAAWAGLRWARSRVNRRAHEVATALRAGGINVVSERVTSWAWRPAQVELDGGARVTVRQWGRASHLISIVAPGPASPPIWIRRERGFDRVAKGLGMEREVELGVPDFDREMYISSRAPDDAVRTTLANSETQLVVQQIVAAGYGVHLFPGTVSASRLVYALNPIDTSAVPSLLAHLRTLATKLPQGGVAVPDGARAMSTGTLLGIALASFCVPMILLAPLRDLMHTPLAAGHILAALGLSLLPSLAVVAAAAKKLQRRPFAIFEVPAVALALMTTLPFVFAVGLFALNAQLDRAPVVKHHTRVVGFYKHNRGTVWVAPWDDATQRQKLILPSSLLPVHEGDAIDVDAHPGALGWPWASNMTRP
jgi:hypothetical protein